MNFKTIRVGRAIDNDIVLDHPSVSRNHLELFYDADGNVFLTDLNSANGTFVNGQRIKNSVQLKPNDIVKAGICAPLRWRNFTKKNDPIEGKVVELHDDTTFGQNDDLTSAPKTKERNVWRIIAITIVSLLLLIGLFFVLNEYIIVDPKPPIVDPDKPNDKTEQPKKMDDSKEKTITYDFSCLDDEDDLGTTEIVGVLEAIDNNVTNTIGGEITIDQEVEVGNQLLSDCRKEYQFIETGNKIKNLRIILKLLTDKILEPKGFTYSIYLIDSKELNAFTAGAKIFVTSRMYKFCLSNDELACVIGHEINHNELGHIKQYLQKEKILTSGGAALSQMLTIPFGQKKETHCDFKGIDLAIAAGYNGCVNISLWKRMKVESDEGDYNAMDNLFRSHPYSEKRSICSKNHITTNYGFTCPDEK